MTRRNIRKGLVVKDTLSENLGVGEIVEKLGHGFIVEYGDGKRVRYDYVHNPIVEVALESSNEK